MQKHEQKKRIFICAKRYVANHITVLARQTVDLKDNIIDADAEQWYLDPLDQSSMNCKNQRLRKLIFLKILTLLIFDVPVLARSVLLYMNFIKFKKGDCALIEHDNKIHIIGRICCFIVGDSCHDFGF